MRFERSFAALPAALLSAALAFGAPAVAAETKTLAVYEGEAVTPPVDHVIGRVHVRECGVDSTKAHSEAARSEAIAMLQKAASSKGANALLHVQVKVTESNMPYLNKGLTNGCLFETAAKGDAAVISSAKPAAAQLSAEAK